MKKIIIKFLAVFLLIFAQGENAFADFSFRDMELNFVQISDTHVSNREDTAYKLLSQSKALLEDAVKQTNAIKNLDFVMFTGDMVDEPLLESYRDFFIEVSKLQFPVFTTFGNHDAAQLLNMPEGAPPYIQKYEALNFIKACDPFYFFDKNYYAFTPKKDYRVIVLDTMINDAITSNGKLTTEQAAFLKNELETHQDKVIIIFHHHPVVQPFKSEHHKLLNSDEYMDIIKQYKKTPIAIFSGHYHAARITKQGNIIHVSTPSLVTYPNAFRYVNITNYNDRTIFKIGYKETGLEDLQSKAKIGAIGAATLRGGAGDHDAEITIRKNRKYNNELNEPKVKLPKEELQVQKEMRKLQKQEAKQMKREMKAQKRLNKLRNNVEEAQDYSENAETLDDVELLRQN